MVAVLHYREPGLSTPEPQDRTFKLPQSSPVPSYLVDRFKSWKRVKFEDSKAWYARLMEDGQRPRTMLISCCDSRLDTVAMFGAEPGDLFVVRNVANLAPPYAPDQDREKALRELEHEAVRTSLMNLASFPFVKDALDAGSLTLHGAWIDIASGQMHALDDQGVFAPV